MKMDIWKILINLKKQNKITKQQFRTYKGQILSGDIQGAIKGLERKQLIVWN